MKINGKITFLVNREFTEIEIYDADASVQFCNIRLTPEQLSSMLARMGYVSSCDMRVANLDKVGKLHENKTYEFEITDVSSRDDDALYHAAKTSLKNDGMNEWEPDKYFRSQNSFFSKNGNNWARCTIRRWIQKS